MHISQEHMNSILDKFKIEAECINASTNRHFAFYDLELFPGCKINKISRYSGELALAMRANSPIIIKPIPNQGIVRLQTTHKLPDTLQFGELFHKYYSQYPREFSLLIGESDEGAPVWWTLPKDPHLLIAGSTGSGKSTLLHSIIYNARMFNNVRLYLIDTKRVEFNIYSSIAGRIFCGFDYNSAVNLLERTYGEMENRYNIMAELGISSIDECRWPMERLIVIIDEVSDLMLNDKEKYIENLLAKLAQKSRAAGIYIVLATQRPSVNVLTGLIKANFQSRIACRVSSKIDSRIILDRQGAENLIGRGDAIINNSQYSYTRFQVAFVSKQDINFSVNGFKYE